MKILLIEDDENTASTLAEALTTHDYSVNAAVDAQTGLKLARLFNYDHDLLDIKPAKLDGAKLCRKLRDSGCQKPIVLLSAKDGNADRVMGLEAGADDYMVKPYNLPELVNRIGALVKRGSFTAPAILTWEKLRGDREMHSIVYEGKPIHLTPKEFCLLELFLANPRRIFSRSALLESIWSFGDYPGEQAVTTHINSIRQKLKAAGMSANIIETVYGFGYRVQEPQAQKADSDATVSSMNANQREKQAKLMTMVAEIWRKFQGDLAEKVAIFERACSYLALGNLDSQLQQQAKLEAHKLAGSLGCFGLPEGSKVAREIENLLKDERLRQREAARLEELVRLLKQELEKQPSTSATTSMSEERN